MNRIMQPWSVMVNFHLLSIYQVKNAQTSLFPTFSWIFHCQLHLETMSTSLYARCSASTLFLAVVKIKTTSVNIGTTGSLQSLFARSLI